jgi:hypothetical protein
MILQDKVVMSICVGVLAGSCLFLVARRFNHSLTPLSLAVKFAFIRGGGMKWRNFKILSHGMWDAKCIPPMAELPHNVALVFYGEHGQPVLAHEMRPIETENLDNKILTELRSRGISGESYDSMKEVLKWAFDFGLKKEIIAPGMPYYNYRLTHLGTKIDTRGLAMRDPMAGSAVPVQIDGNYFMPGPTQKFQLDYVVRSFVQPHAPPDGFVIGHCLFCRSSA